MRGMLSEDRPARPVRRAIILIALLAALTVVGVVQDEPQQSVTPVANGVIAFVRSSGRDAEIVLVDPASDRIASITRGPGNRGGPAWSPDGSRIAFAWRQGWGGGFHLWTVAADGSAVRRLTDGPWIDGTPTWAPDGSAIAFSSNRDGPSFAVYLVGTNGGSLRRLAAGQGPSWSPAGDLLALVRVAGDSFDVFTLHPDGSGVRNVTGHIADDRDPSWSPDGRRIVFASDRDGDFDLYVVDAAGGQSQRLTGGALFDLAPAWGAAS
jgi:Tol biopolymer transport system component